MPIALQYDLPRTKSYDEFEDMVTDYFRKQGFSAQRYGRNGQNQHGIDIIATFVNSIGESNCIAIQCKNYSPSQTEMDQIIDKAITGIRAFSVPFCKIIIALGEKRDTKIQNYVMAKKLPNITLEVLFWEDISSIIASNDDLLSRYYPQMQNSTPNINSLVDFFNEGIRGV